MWRDTDSTHLWYYGNQIFLNNMIKITQPVKVKF